MGMAQFLIAAVVLAILMVFGSVWAIQTFGIYHFNAVRQSPADFDLPRVRVVHFLSEDGSRIRAWVAKPQAGRPVILALYGNGASIGPSMQRLKPLILDGYGMAMMEYRGSGETLGRPSELALAADARAFYDQFDEIVGQPVPADMRVLHGFSLGAGVGSRLAANRAFAAVIFEAAPFRTCLYYQRRYFGLPLCHLMWAERYDVVDHVRKIGAPKLFVWGSDDQTLPAGWSRRLFAAAPEPKEFIELDGGHHADLDRHGLIPAMEGFLAARFGAP